MFPQYAAKEFQQALDILDMEEPACKKLLDRSGKEDKSVRESGKDWEMSTASVSPNPDWEAAFHSLLITECCSLGLVICSLLLHKSYI